MNRLIIIFFTLLAFTSIAQTDEKSKVKPNKKRSVKRIMPPFVIHTDGRTFLCTARGCRADKAVTVGQSSNPNKGGKKDIKAKKLASAQRRNLDKMLGLRMTSVSGISAPQGQESMQSDGHTYRVRH